MGVIACFSNHSVYMATKQWSILKYRIYPIESLSLLKVPKIIQNYPGKFTYDYGLWITLKFSQENEHMTCFKTNKINLLEFTVNCSGERYIGESNTY